MIQCSCEHVFKRVKTLTLKAILWSVQQRTVNEANVFLHLIWLQKMSAMAVIALKLDLQAHCRCCIVDLLVLSGLNVLNWSGLEASACNGTEANGCFCTLWYRLSSSTLLTSKREAMPLLSSPRMVNSVGSKCVERTTGVLCLPVGSLTDVQLDFIAEWGMADRQGVQGEFVWLGT